MSLNAIFASDLDRTLIYSKNAFDTTNDIPVKVVEYFNGFEQSFMTEKAISLLTLLQRSVCFVPSTTRTIEQYNRIFFNENKPQLAIVSNGGNVIINGKIDYNWSKIINSKTNHEALHLNEVIRRFKEISNPIWVKNSKIADNYFFYSVIDRENLLIDELSDFIKWLKINNWDFSIQGKKMYLTPKYVNKGDALEYIKILTGIETVVGAGDSLLDINLLNKSTHPIIPAHGEIYERILSKDLDMSIKITNKSGILASEEILDFAYKIANNENIIKLSS